MSILNQRYSYRTAEEQELALKVWSEVIDFGMLNPNTLPIEWKKAAYDKVGIYNGTVARAGAESIVSVKDTLLSETVLMEEIDV